MDWDPGKCTLHHIQPIFKELIMALLISLTLFRSVLLRSQSQNSSSDFMQHVTSRRESRIRDIKTRSHNVFINPLPTVGWDPGKCTLHQIQPIFKELMMALTSLRSVLLKSQSQNSSSDFMQHVTSRGPQDVPLQMKVDSLQKSSWNHSHLSQNHSSLRGKYKIQQETVNSAVYTGIKKPESFSHSGFSLKVARQLPLNTPKNPNRKTHLRSVIFWNSAKISLVFCQCKRSLQSRRYYSGFWSRHVIRDLQRNHPTAARDVMRSTRVRSKVERSRSCAPLTKTQVWDSGFFRACAFRAKNPECYGFFWQCKRYNKKPRFFWILVFANVNGPNDGPHKHPSRELPEGISECFHTSADSKLQWWIVIAIQSTLPKSNSHKSNNRLM